jgi:hypothetical protein
LLQDASLLRFQAGEGFVGFWVDGDVAFQVGDADGAGIEDAVGT